MRTVNYPIPPRLPSMTYRRNFLPEYNSEPYPQYNDENGPVNPPEDDLVNDTEFNHELPKCLVCPDCDTQFTGDYRRGNLTRHRQRTHGEALFRCEHELCDKAYKRSNARLKHYRKHHPELDTKSRYRRTRAALQPQMVHHLHNETDSLSAGSTARNSRLSRITCDNADLESSIPVTVNGFSVSALPDTCSSFNIVSEKFIVEHGLNFNPNGRTSIRLPNSKEIMSSGTSMLDLRFDGEDTLFSLAFVVLPSCVQDIILGDVFLETTETLTKYACRIKRSMRTLLDVLPLPRVCLVDRARRVVHGSIDGKPVSASPDTGSDLNLLSKEFAVELGLHIDTDPKHSTCLEFVNRDSIETDGIVRNVEWRFGVIGHVPAESHFPIKDKGIPEDIPEWEFGEDATAEDRYICDFWVVENLSCPIILSRHMLLGPNAFQACAEAFRTKNSNKRNRDEGSEVFFIREGKKIKRTSLLNTFLRHPTTASSVGSSTSIITAK